MGPLALRARKSPSAAAMARGRHNDDESSRVMSMDALTVCFSFKKVLVIGILPVRCLLAEKRESAAPQRFETGFKTSSLLRSRRVRERRCRTSKPAVCVPCGRRPSVVTVCVCL